MTSAIQPNWSQRLVLLITLILAIALTSCHPEPTENNQLVLSVPSDPKTFNFLLSQESPNIFGLTFKGLTYINGNGKIEPELAESWKISEDKLRVIFTLREGLKWSDGQPLTADDVVFTYQELVFNKQIPNTLEDYLKIGTTGVYPQVRRIDDRRVEFILPEPFAPFLQTTAAPTDAVAILPKHVLSKYVKLKDSKGNPKFLSTWGTDTNPTKIIVNGPYQIESYIANQRLVFQRNPYYWRKDSQGHSQPYIKRIIWQIVDSPDTSLIQFRSGGLDTLGVGATNFSLLKREEKRGKFTIYNGGPALGTTFIAFNLNKGQRNGRPLVDPIKSSWFNKVAFRQAIAYALDRQTIVNNLYRGLGEPQNSPIDIQTPYYLSPKAGLKVYNYDPERAKKLLMAAGFNYNAQNQLFDADGNRVQFTLLSPAGGRTADTIGTRLKQDLNKIGIKVDFNPLAFNVLIEKLSNSLDWECYLGALTGSVEPSQGANVWLPEGSLHTFNQKPQSGQSPITGWEAADWEREIGNLYIQGAKELDEAKRKAIYAQTQRLTQEYLPYIYLVNPLSLAAVRDRVQGIKMSAFEGALWNIYELKVKEK